MKNLILRSAMSVLITAIILTGLRSQSCVDTTVSHVHYSLDDCEAYVLAGSVKDYSEFTGLSTGECGTPIPLSTVYRINPAINTHSCTPGIDSSLAMCISSLDSCLYQPGSEKALRFEVMVSPTSGTSTWVNALSFYEQAPEEYFWIDGPSGPNNFPLYYGIRILRNGVEIFRQASISTGREWNFNKFVFSDLPQFEVDVPSLFEFELLSYCPAGIDSEVTAWDIDEIDVELLCLSEGPEASEICFDGNQKSISICAGDGIDDIYSVNVNGGTASQQVWIVTDTNGLIIDLPVGSPFNFENYNLEECCLWLLGFDASLSGLEISNHVSDIQGCYVLSNKLSIIHSNIPGKQIEFFGGGDYQSICLNETGSFNIDVQLSQDTFQNVWVITDANGIIQSYPGQPPFEFDNAVPGRCLLLNINYGSAFILPAFVTSIYDIDVCIGLSNSLTVDKLYAEGGIISIDGNDELEICVSTGGTSQSVMPELTGNLGMGSLWLITTTEGDLLQFTSSLPINLDSYNADTCLLWHLSFEGNLAGLLVGSNVSGLSGCYDLSNSVRLVKRHIEGPEIAYNGSHSLFLCDMSELLVNFSPDISGFVGDSIIWIISDGNGLIVELSTSLPLDLSGYAGGSISVYALADPAGSIDTGSSVEELSELCLSLSNGLHIESRTTDAGSLSYQGSTDVTICEADANGRLISLQAVGHAGNNSRYIVTDENGAILLVQESGLIDFSVLADASFTVYHMDYLGLVTDLSVGSNINSLTGCYSLSNGLRIEFIAVDGGEITTLMQSYEISICLSAGDNSIIELLRSGSVGFSDIWLITDTDNRIQEIYSQLPLDVSMLESGNYRIWSLAYSGSIQNLELQVSLDDLIGDCFELSNFISLSISDVQGGVISSDLGDVIDVCANDGVSDIVNVHLTGNSGQSSLWVLTDTNGVILRFLPFPPIDVDDGQEGVCLIWHLAFSQNIVGLVPGNSIFDLQGCFGLSNAIRFEKEMIESGDLSVMGLTEVDLCLNNNQSVVSFRLTGTSTANNLLLILSESGQVLETSQSLDIDFGLVSGSCLVANLAYGHDFGGVQAGMNISDLEGCYALSNTVRINKHVVEPGVLTTLDGDSIVICRSDGIPDLVDFQITGFSAPERLFVIIDSVGDILGFTDNSTINLGAYSNSEFNVVHLVFSEISGLVLGSNLGNLEGCFAYSNRIHIKNLTVEGGTLDSDLGREIDICVEDNNADPVSLLVSGATGSSNLKVITDAAGIVLDFFSGNSYDLDNGITGEWHIWNLSYELGITGLVVGSPISNISGCFALSNSVTVHTFSKDPVNISIDGHTEIDICVSDGQPDIVLPQIENGTFNPDESTWILTENGVITMLSTDLSIDLDNNMAGQCQLWLVCTVLETSGIETGASISGIQGCFSLSNPVTVRKTVYVPADATSSTISFDFNDCYSDTQDGSNMDYSEFTPSVDNDRSCVQFQLIDSFLYRSMPEIYWHSCTEGQEGLAMCVGALDSCAFETGSSKAVRYAFAAVPGPSGIGNLSSLRFYEQAPERYDWINGPDGPNNYPQLYGMRILRDNVEIYREIDLPTGPSWSLQEFSFEGLPDFYFSETTVFELEFLAYCLVDNGAVVQAWDMDQLTIASNCRTGLFDAIITSITGELQDTLCIEPGIYDPLQITVLEGSDLLSRFIVTDSTGSIVDGFFDTSYDFSGYQPGSYEVRMLTTAMDTFGPLPGYIADLEGCYELSNAIAILLVDGDDCGSSGGRPFSGETEPIIDQLSDDIQLYPNPVADLLTIELEVELLPGAQLCVFNRMGERVNGMQLQSTRISIETGHLTDGFYYIRVCNGEDVMLKSFIKH